MTLARDWTLLHRRYVSDHRIFRVREDRYRLEGHAHERDYVVIDSPDWINVIPITADGQVVLIRQYRHGVEDVTLEIPGGMVDAGEDPAAAAARELREETGYASRDVIRLGTVWPNPAVQNNTCHTFLALGATLAGTQHPDPFERIDVETHPLAEIPRLIADGTIKHSLVVMAFGFLGILRSPVEIP